MATTAKSSDGSPEASPPSRTSTVRLGGSEPRSSSGPPAAEVFAFLVQLGVSLLATGDAVSDIERRLLDAAKAYRQPGTRVMVLPTAVLVAGAGGRAMLATHDGVGSTELRLDQVTAVLNVAAAAGKAELSPAEGRERLEEVRAMPN